MEGAAILALCVLLGGRGPKMKPDLKIKLLEQIVGHLAILINRYPVDEYREYADVLISRARKILAE